MRWLNIDYTSKINDFSKFTDGNHASFSIAEIEGEKYLFKKYDEKCDSNRKMVIDKFENITYDKVNAFPVGNFFIDGENRGYLSKYYEGAVNFSDPLSFIIPYDVRYQATLDVSSQLRFLHENGVIANDIRLANNLISFRERCGVMIDFEDMILESNYVYRPSYYHFYLDDDHLVFASPTKLDDVKKQFVCNTSLLLGKNLESVIMRRAELFLDMLSFDQDIYDFTRTLFYSEEMLYFDEIAPKFQDEEKVKSYIKE